MKTTIIKLVITTSFLLFTLVSHSQTRLDSINSMVEYIIAENRLVAVFLGTELQETPIGMLRTMGDVQYVVAISQLKLNEQGDFESDVYLRIQIGNQPAEGNILFFGANAIPLTQAGGFGGDISLAFLGTLGYQEAMGAFPTRAVISCYWDDILVEISMPTLENYGLIVCKGAHIDDAEPQIEKQGILLQDSPTLFDYAFVSPNPSRGYFELRFRTKRDADLLIQLFRANIAQQPVRTFRKNARAYQTETISVENLPSGTYILTIQDNTERQTIKIIVI